jgi:hypothetical protein
MLKRLARLALPLIVLAVAVMVSASSPRPAYAICYIWQGTNYYSDAAHTTRVGQCTITCAQFDLKEPTFTGGGTCWGVPSSYEVHTSYGCPGICR